MAARSKKLVKQPQVRREDAVRSKAAIKRDRKRVLKASASAIRAARQCKLSACVPPESYVAYSEQDRVPSPILSKKVSTVNDYDVSLQGGIKAFRVSHQPEINGDELKGDDVIIGTPNSKRVMNDHSVAGIPTSTNMFDALSSLGEDQGIMEDFISVQQFQLFDNSSAGDEEVADQHVINSPVVSTSTGAHDKSVRDSWWIRGFRFIGRMVANVAAVVVTIVKVVDQNTFHKFF